LYLAERRLDDAAQVTIKALSLDSKSPEGFAHLAMLLFAEGSTEQDHPDSAKRAFDAAIDAADRAIRAKPDLAEAWLFKGMILMAGKQDPKGAAQAWEQYLKVAPPDADTTRIHAMVQAAKRAG
jgi:tetratricopeptide (TPR) repeat protein